MFIIHRLIPVVETDRGIRDGQLAYKILKLKKLIC